MPSALERQRIAAISGYSTLTVHRYYLGVLQDRAQHAAISRAALQLGLRTLLCAKPSTPTPARPSARRIGFN
jgi:hypothetical protein